MNAYTPILDAWGTVALVAVLVVLAFDLAVGCYFNRKSRELFRRGGMWGGE